MSSTLRAEATYRSPVSLQGAAIRIHANGMGFFIGATIGGEDDGSGYAWTARASTYEEARAIGNRWHTQLKTQYGMKRL